MNYFFQNKPTVFPTNDGLLIKEHFGRISTSDEHISIAHLVAPPGWIDPYQTPRYDEWTLVSRGRKMVEVDGEQIIINPGHSILVKKGARVRYSNPFEEECEYWCICLPAFSMDTANRED